MTQEAIDNWFERGIINHCCGLELNGVKNIRNNFFENSLKLFFSSLVNQIAAEIFLSIFRKECGQV